MLNGAIIILHCGITFLTFANDCGIIIQVVIIVYKCCEYLLLFVWLIYLALMMTVENVISLIVCTDYWLRKISMLEIFC